MNDSDQRHFRARISKPVLFSFVLFICVTLVGYLYVSSKRIIPLTDYTAPKEWKCAFRVPLGWVDDCQSLEIPGGTMECYIEPDLSRILRFRWLFLEPGATADSLCLRILNEYHEEFARGSLSDPVVEDARFGTAPAKFVKWYGQSFRSGRLASVLVMSTISTTDDGRQEAYTVELQTLGSDKRRDQAIWQAVIDSIDSDRSLGGKSDGVSE